MSKQSCSAQSWMAWGLALMASLLLAACASTGAPAPVSDRSSATSTGGAAANSADFYTVKKGDTLISIALEHGHDYKTLAAWNNLDNPNRITIGQQLRVTPPNTAPNAAPTENSDVVVTPIKDSTDTPPAAAGTAAGAPGADILKTSPKGGKAPYSPELLAQMRGLSAPPASPASPAPPAAATPATPVAPPPPEAAKPATDELAWALPAPGKIISGFSESSKGIDFAGKSGDPVQAAEGGKVVYVGSGLKGYGNMLIVRHNPTYLSAYAHASKILVKEGDEVKRGQKIAEFGASDADQVKLHFEIRKMGKPVDPAKFLPGR